MLFPYPCAIRISRTLSVFRSVERSTAWFVAPDRGVFAFEVVTFPIMQEVRLRPDHYP